jgi:hypothetical protein
MAMRGNEGWGGLDIDLLIILSTRELWLWRAQWSVATSSVMKCKLLHLWATVDTKNSKPLAGRLLKPLELPPCMCGLVLDGTKSSELKSGRLLHFPSCIAPVWWFTARQGLNTETRRRVLSSLGFLPFPCTSVLFTSPTLGCTLGILLRTTMDSRYNPLLAPNTWQIPIGEDLEKSFSNFLPFLNCIFKYCF